MLPRQLIWTEVPYNKEQFGKMVVLESGKMATAAVGGDNGCAWAHGCAGAAHLRVFTRHYACRF